MCIVESHLAFYFKTALQVSAEWFGWISAACIFQSDFKSSIILEEKKILHSEVFAFLFKQSAWHCQSCIPLDNLVNNYNTYCWCSLTNLHSTVNQKVIAVKGALKANGCWENPSTNPTLLYPTCRHFPTQFKSIKETSNRLVGLEGSFTSNTIQKINPFHLDYAANKNRRWVGWRMINKISNPILSRTGLHDTETAHRIPWATWKLYLPKKIMENFTHLFLFCLGP